MAGKGYAGRMRQHDLKQYHTYRNDVPTLMPTLMQGQSGSQDKGWPFAMHNDAKSQISAMGQHSMIH